jgi:hypothetical protein
VIENRKSRFSIFDQPTKSSAVRGFVLASNFFSGLADLVKAHFLAVVDPSMQIGKVCGIQTTFARLRPIALLKLLGHETMTGRDFSELELW